MNNFTEAEKQIITVLSWFRTRYALFLNLDINRRADRKNLEDFGNIWIGNFKCNWQSAFSALVKKEILVCAQGEYQFTAEGERIKQQIEAKTPFFKYEYDHFFDSEKKSHAHSLFCKQVYGKDLAQHGLIDMKELSILIDKLNTQQPKTIADVGCGNGKITEYLSQQIQAHITGIDISHQGIKLANERTEGNNALLFKEGNLNNIDFVNAYDAILFLDTLYYADDLQDTIEKAMNGLTKNGHLYVYFSQWIMDTAFTDTLKPNNTHLAKVLANLGLNYAFTDLSISGINHWKKKLKTLVAMKTDFANEDNIDLWDYRYREAYRYANWGDHKYTRYLYDVKN
ncbi:methyltransferase [Winogradskyella costae]|uniref:methyltransferase n=1 Tax=Winogradskyella costae TaxID=2697008 RepID=UPI0015CBAF7C|nr:class I SAM-dependent methyltransferase [Winogradskyella costae]